MTGVSIFLLCREYLSLANNMLTNTPKISDSNNRDFFEPFLPENDGAKD